MEVVCFGTYNTQKGRNGVLNPVLLGMAQANADLGLLQGTKITVGVYAQESAGFCVIVSDDLSRHCRSVEIFYKDLPRFVVEAYMYRSSSGSRW